MKRASTVALVFALFAPACEDAPRDGSQWPLPKSALGATPPAEDAGEAAYRRTCIACHGLDGRGNGGTTAADLTRPDGPRTMTDDALRAVIHDGRRGAIGVMPAHGTILSAADLEAVLRFVRRRYAPAEAIAAPTGDAGASDAAASAPAPSAP